MTPIDVVRLFKDAGLRHPSVIYIFAGEWVEPDFPVAEGVRGTARRECTCCECNLYIGPPGCDGENCRRCGDSRCGG